MAFDEKTGIDFPFFQNQVEDLFGEPDEDGEFAKSYMTVIDLSEFKPHFDHVRDYTGKLWKYKIHANYVMEDPLRKAFSLIVQRDLCNQLKTYDGCFNIRASKGGGIRSMHSWALAIDFNAGSNGYGRKPTMSAKLVKCFAECGFEWGGLWSTPDGMHFQIVWVRQRTNEHPLNPVAWKNS